MPLVLTNKLFKSPSGLFFKYCGIIRVVPTTVDKIKIYIDFHVFAILEYELHIGHPLDNLIQEKPSHGGLDEKLEETAFTTPISCLENPMVKQHSNHDPFEEVKFISPFISLELSCEMNHPSPPSLELEPCPTGHPNIILENKNFCAMDISEQTLETKRRDSTYEHKNFTFKTPQVSCSFLKSPELISFSSTCYHEDHNHVSILISKLFRRMVVDAYVYQKYCRSQGCIMVLTLQLEHYC
jgi:hypothetical protein